MSSLIIGATGNIGQRVVQALLDIDSEVTAFVRESERDSSTAVGVLARPEVRRAYGDLSRPDSVRRAAEGCRAIFVLTPHSPDQVTLQKVAVDAAADVGARVVKLSSWGPAVYEGTPVPGAHRHWLTQQYVVERGVPHTFLCPNHFMQVLLTLYSGVVRRSANLPSPPGKGGISMVDARDVAEVAALVLTQDGHDGQTYTLSGPTTPSYVDIATSLTALTGREVTAQVDMSKDEFLAFMASEGRADWDAEHAWAIYQLYRQGIGELVTDDVERITGHPPRTIEAFLAETRHEFMPQDS